MKYQMWNLLVTELYKIFRKPRTYIAFLAIAVLVLLIQAGFYFDGESYIRLGLQSLSEDFMVEGKILNGYFMAYIILQTLLVHIPLLVALVAADMISGEANMGTLRLLMTQPVSRKQVILAKFFAACMYTLLLLLWLAFWALPVSLALFGTDDMLILKSDVVIQLPASDILWRYLAAFGFAALAMITVAALAFLLSLFSSNSIGPIIATMSIVIMLTLLNTLELPVFNTMRPYLFTSHMLGWKGLFDARSDGAGGLVPGSVENLPAVLRSASILGLHVLAFLSTSLLVFQRKDILS